METASSGQVIKGNCHRGKVRPVEPERPPRFCYLSSFKHNDEIIVTLNWLKTEIWQVVKFIVSSFAVIQVWFP